VLEQETISRIKVLLKVHPKGLTITDISSRLKMNRNSAAKYLEILQISGVVECQTYGTARVYSLSHRLPISALVSIASDLVVTLDDTYRILYVNDALCRVFSLKKNDVAGNHILEIFKTGIEPDTLPAVFSDVLANQDIVHEVQISRNDGDLFFKIKSMRTVYDDGSRGITIIMEDITREKKDTIELEEKEARYRAIVEDQTEFVVRFSPAGTITFSNSAFAHYLRKDPQELKITRFISFVREEDQKNFVSALNTLTPDDPVTRLECRFIPHQGRECWIAWTIRALFNGNRGLVEYQAAGQDITERKTASENLHRYIAQIEFFSRKLQQFIELPPDGNIYYAIGAGLFEILPDAVIAVSMYDPDETTLVVKAVLDEQSLDLISQTIGTYLIGMKIPVADTFPPEELLTGTVHNTHKKLFEIFFQQVPLAICTEIEDALNLGDIYSVGIIWQGRFLGNITFALRKGAEPGDTSLVETYVRAASISLQRTVAENALRESESRYRSVLENIQDVFYRSDAEGNLIMASPSWASLLGYDSLEECLGRNIARDFYLIPEKRREFIQAITAQGSVQDYEVVLRKKDHTPVHVSTNSHPWYGPDGKFLGIEGIFHNITERKKADHMHRLLSSIVESSGDAIIGKDPNGTVISWNRAAERLYGYLADEMIGMPISRILPPEEAGETEEFFSLIGQSPSAITRETRRVHKDGRIIDVSVTISPITDADGEIIGVSTIARDITTHKAEARMRENEDQYRSLVDNIAVGFYRSTGDPSGRFIWGNTSLVKILGYPSLDKLREVEIAGLFVDHDGRGKLLEELIQEGFVKNKEISLRRADGSTVTVLITALAGFDALGTLTCINGIVEDISCRRQAEEHVQVADAAMQEILSVIPYPVIRVNEENAVVAWNPAMERWTGVLQDRIMGRTDFEPLLPFYDASRPSLFTLMDAPNNELEKFYPGAYRDGSAIITRVPDPARTGDFRAGFTLRASPVTGPGGARAGAILFILSGAHRATID
jgi:PAS domain S-box-containing protein